MPHRSSTELAHSLDHCATCSIAVEPVATTLMEGLSHLHCRVAGIDVHRVLHAAAPILIEIGGDMARFGSPERLACWAAVSP